MIDEELYQQAADELNSDRRRPHIWARACALASDDHDEARYLYTNLRVEELIAERESNPDHDDADDQGLLDQTLALEPAFEDSTVKITDDDVDFAAAGDDPLQNLPASNFGNSDNLSIRSSEPVERSAQTDELQGAADQLKDGVKDGAKPELLPEATEASLDEAGLADQLEKRTGSLDDTYAGLEDPTEVFHKELESLKAEQGGVNIFESTAAFSRHLDGYSGSDEKPTAESIEMDDTAVDFDGSNAFNIDPAEIDRLAGPDPVNQSQKQPSPNQPASQSRDPAADVDKPGVTAESQVEQMLSEADYQPEVPEIPDAEVNNDVEEVLADTVYHPTPEPRTGSDLEWLDEEPAVSNDGAGKREPVIITDDALDTVVEGTLLEGESEHVPDLSDLSDKPQDMLATASDSESDAADTALPSDLEQPVNVTQDEDAYQPELESQTLSIDQLAVEPSELAATDLLDDTVDTTTFDLPTESADIAAAASTEGSAFSDTAKADLDPDASANTGNTALGAQQQEHSDAALEDETQSSGAENSTIKPAIDSTDDESQQADADHALAASVAHEAELEHSDSSSSAAVAAMPATYPLDLTQGDDRGKEFAIYQRQGKTQIVSTGVSWSALFVTLPFLVYRHMLGTAIVYALMAAILIGGFIVSFLAWHDAGSSVTPFVQACTIAFGLLCFIGLIYLPFRYGNLWRGAKLENRGFEMLARVKARSPGHALSQLRSVANLDI